MSEELTGLEVAIIGMAGKFPGASNLDTFKENLQNGSERITTFSDEELIETGTDPELLKNPNYIKTKGFLQNAEHFDAEFFNYTPMEALVMDPQLRIFHEISWEALENAGYDPESYDGNIGLYAGAATNNYWQLASLLAQNEITLDPFSAWQLLNKDTLPTHISYKLNLRGPSYLLQTACSTSLVAVHVATQALISGECTMAMAGGVTVNFPRKDGYLYQEGMVFSPDGHCRTFDAAGRGTVGGEGAAVVVLKMLEDALEDGDHIHAVIKGSAVNNDGSRRTGYTAPGVQGQVSVIKTAQKVANVPPESIGCIEAHGTATTLGDPIEIEALTQAFNTEKKQFCAVGSVKTNIGHCDIAAGIAGLIKTILSLKDKKLYPSLHFKTPNPHIDFDNSPFFVNTKLQPWINKHKPLRAAVSSFGIGGTNAHVILEQAPPIPKRKKESKKIPHLIVLSARTPNALEAQVEQYREFFKNRPRPGLRDIAYTLQAGRRHFKFRKSLEVTSTTQAAEKLEKIAKRRRFQISKEDLKPIFMFSGLGAQYLNMGKELYQHVPVFKETADLCFEILEKETGTDFKNLLYPEKDENGGDGKGGKKNGAKSQDIDSHHLSQPLLFTFEYALAKTLIHWGIQPHALIGYSFGEYTAAAVSGVFSPETALKIIVTRGKLVDEIPGGAMMSIPLPKEKLLPLLPPEIAIAIDNGDACIVSGPEKKVSQIEKQMKKERLLCFHLAHASHAIHSPAMSPLRKKFKKAVRKMKLKEPGIPYISNVTGGWITTEEARSAQYWCRHLESTVQFAAGLKELAKIENALFIEIGPGRELATMIKRFVEDKPETLVMDTIPQAPNGPGSEPAPELRFLFNRAGRMWEAGLNVQWQHLPRDPNPLRVPLPGYPFQRNLYTFNVNPFQVLDRLTKGKGALELPASGLVVTGGGEAGDRATVPAAAGVRDVLLDSPYVPPAGEAQETMSRVWKEFFGLDRVGIKDDFFELGGDSLKAMNLSNLLQKEMDVDIPVPEFFNNPTVETLAQFASQHAVKETFDAIPAAEQKEYYPLSTAQTRIYLLQQMDPNATPYNEQIALVLQPKGDLDIEKITETFRELIQRHESFRTSFHLVEGEPRQRIHDDVPFEIEFQESSSPLSPLPSREHLSFIRPFDLSQPPMFRVQLVKQPEKEYILVVDIHHIISDGTSQAVLVRDFAALYAGEELPPLEVTYKDFAQWQNQRYLSAAFRRRETYWLHRFDPEQGDFPELELPYDSPRAAVLRFEGGKTGFTFDASETAPLREIAKAEGVTLFMTLLALFKLLLSKLSGQEDIITGTPVAGRRHADVRDIIGIFINTLALRTHLTAGAPLREFLAEIKRYTLQAFENQDYPFDRLVETVVRRRNTSRNPLFDVLFALQNIDRPEAQLPGLSIKPYETETRTSRFDISLTAYENGEELLFGVEYSTALFEPGTVERFIACFRQLAHTAAVPGALERPLKSIEIVPQQEKELILNQFNVPRVEFPQDKTLHQLFEEQVEKTPDAVALVGSGAALPGTGSLEIFLTYRGLDRRARGLAALLREKGVGPETIVALMTHHNLEMGVALMAILKSGGAYLPIDPAYPRDRIEYMLADSNAGVLLALPGIPRPPDFTGEFVEIDINQGGEDGPGHGETASANSDNLVYVIYTSGTTGWPKGAMMAHRGVVNSLCFRKNKLRLGPGHTAVQLFSYSFDGFVTSFFTPLLAGARVLLPLDAERGDVDLLARVISRHRVSHFIAVPSLFHALLQRLTPAEAVTLRAVGLGGEALPFSLLEAARQLNPNLELANEYGVTEAAVISTFCRHLEQEERVHLGKPVDNTNIYILDRRGNVVPIGVPGEICIAGTGLARGYLNRPELTAKRFADGYYRTGDLGYWMPDGNIFYLGRIDFQVKVRGFRIELGEIEYHLNRREDVKTAVVSTRTAGGGDTYLCAYIVPRDGKSLDTSRLKTHLHQMVPVYMVPSHFVLLEELPLTPNGKVDRKALPEPDAPETETYTAPRDEAEAQLLELMTVVLFPGGTQTGPSPGIDADFFQLGGHSLKATLLTARIQKHMNIRIPLVQIFKTPTVRGLAQFIAQDKTTAAHQPIPRAEIRENYPLSPAQKRLYILQQIEGAASAYNIPHLMKLHGTPDIARIEKAFQQLVERHESLRTSFHMLEEEPVQVIHPPEDISFQVEYLTPEDFPNSPDSSAPPSFIRPFDLARPPLLRVGLLEQREDTYFFMVDMHHIISDGTSAGILVNQFISLYNRRELPPPGIQYKDFALWRAGRREELERQAAYWRDLFAGQVPILDLPADFPRPPVQEFDGAVYSFQLDAAGTAGIKKTASGSGATLFMKLLAVLNILFAKLSGLEDIVVGTVNAGRHHPDTEGVIGMFVNTLALRNAPGGDKTVEDFTAEVKTRTLEAFENQEFPFEDLVEQVEVNRDLGRNPIFDVMFSMLNLELQALEIPGMRLEPCGFEQGVSKFDMTWEMMEAEDRLMVSVQYALHLFKEETVKRFAGYFSRIAAAAGRDPSMRLRDIDILPAEEKEHILRTFNATIALFPEDKRLHELFEEQVENYPGHMAVLGGNLPASVVPAADETTDANEDTDVGMTYALLNACANRLARRLMEKGAGPGGIVAIAAEGSAEMITAILAVLKTGAAYVPVSPGLPPERIRYMLADSAASLVLTQPAVKKKYAETWDSLPGIRLLPLDEPASYDADPSNPGCGGSPTDPVYIIYTSGTTGKPKGVVLEHRGVVNYVHWASQVYVDNGNNGEKIAFPLYTGISFDLTVTSVFVPLATGNSIVLYPGGDGEPLIRQVVEENRVEVIKATPAHLALVKESVGPGSIQSKIRRLVLGGENLEAGLVKEIYRIFGQDLEIYNEYGPTETTVGSMIFRCGPGVPYGLSVPIGGPIANTQVFLLDQYGNPVATGVVGELYIGGAGVGRGYLNRPGLTAEKFVFLETRTENGDEDGNGGDDSKKRAAAGPGSPYIRYPIPSQRLYRTGDLARRLPAGDLEFLGRIDHQVKIRGFRIEIEEIENRVLAFPGIGGAVVVDRRDRHGDTYLCAYFTAAGQVDIAALKSHSARQLPDYMLPRFFVPLERIPLTSGGKVDRRALPEPGIQTGEAAATPGNDLEERLAAIWVEVLALENVSPGDIDVEAGFFDMGGHSLKAVRVINSVENLLGVHISLRDMFREPTIRGLARIIAEQQGGPAAAAPFYEIIPQAPEQEHYELSYAQVRLWVLQKKAPQSQAFNMPERIGFDEAPDEILVRKTLDALVRRHESLRTYFTEVEARVMQKIARPEAIEVPLRVIDITHLEDGAAQSELERLTAEESAIPFDLEKPPLLRVKLIHAPAGRFYLIYTMHHLVSDGWSVDLLRRDFGNFYDHFKVDIPFDPTAPAARYIDYAHWHNRRLENREQLENALETWKDQLTQPQVLQLPYYRQPSELTDRSGAGYQCVIDGETSARLNQLARENNASLFMVLLAGFNLLLSQLRGQEDILIGLPGAARQHKDLEDTIGLFVNTLMLRTRLSKEETFQQLLERVRDNALRMLEVQEYPLELICDELKVPYPRLSLFFNMVNMGGGNLQPMPELPLGHLEKVQDTKFDISLYVMEYTDGIGIVYNYFSQLFLPQTIEKMADMYIKVLRKIAADPGLPLKEYTAAKKKKVLKRKK